MHPYGSGTTDHAGSASLSEVVRGQRCRVWAAEVQVGETEKHDCAVGSSSCNAHVADDRRKFFLHCLLMHEHASGASSCTYLVVRHCPRAVPVTANRMTESRLTGSVTIRCHAYTVRRLHLLAIHSVPPRPSCESPMVHTYAAAAVSRPK